MISKVSFLVLLALLASLSSEVAARLYSRSSCPSICTKPSDFIQSLSEVTVPAKGGNRPYAWSILALRQVEANSADLSPPGVGRIVAIVSSCLYEAVAITSEGFKSAVGNPAIQLPKYNAEQARTAVIDGAGFWALNQIFGGKPAFHSVLEQYKHFTWRDPSDLPVTVAASTSWRARGFSYSYSSTASPARRYWAYDLRPFAAQGVRACQRVIDTYTADGFPADGGPPPGLSSADFYTPVNPPQTIAGITDCDALVDLNFWQPLCVPPSEAEFGTPSCQPQVFTAPWAARFTTFALEQGDETDGGNLVPPPPAVGTAEFVDQAGEVLEISGALDDLPKTIAEYWADGPDTTTPPGHLYRVAVDAALAEGLSTEESAELLFTVGNAVNDAGIASWRTKVFYDYLRPVAALQCGPFRDQQRLAWQGPYQGVGLIDMSQWRPFQESNFVTPAFPGYTSGHSTFSAAASEALRLFFKGDRYRGPPCDIVREGESLFEPRSNAVPGLTDVPNQGFDTPGYSPAEDVVLCWDTFTDASDESGLSRLFGGIHIRADDVGGQTLGREVGQAVYNKVQQLTH